jgi:hypothetical protein
LNWKAQLKMWWIRPTGLFGHVRAYLVKPGVWNPGWCIVSIPCWSELYWPKAPWFGCCRSDTMSARDCSISYRYQAVWL